MTPSPPSARPAPSPAQQALALGLFVAACFVAGGIGAVAGPTGFDPWYAALAKPAWTPPDRVFPVVWSILYLVMAVAAWLVWRHGAGRGDVRSALVAFAVQLALNIAWPWSFFAAQSPTLGMAVIVVLLAALVWTVRRFAAVDRLASWLLAPYLLWVAFAAMLNVAIVLMN